MNSRTTLAALLLASSLCGQAPPKQGAAPASKQAAPATKKESEPAKAPTVPPAPTVAESETVITVPGVCAAGTPAESCVTKITRGEFERLLNAMNPNIPVEARRSIANSYAQLLSLASLAQKAGVDKDPNFQIQLHVQTLSFLAQTFQKKVVEDSKPTQQEIEGYYAENSPKYAEYDLRRIVILKSTSSPLKPEEMKSLADKIHDRAAAGEDTDKLEIEACKTAGSAGAPPSTNLGWKRKGGMEQRHEAQILPLHAGEISPVLEDGQAYYIYKVASKRPAPLESVQKDIETTLQTEHLQKAKQQIMDSAKAQLNDAYFGPEPSKNPAALTPPVK